MPHQCTGCGHTFEDGSKEMLSGCPDCGGNKFQFRPSGTTADAALDDTSDDEGATTRSSSPPDRKPGSSGTEPPSQDHPNSDTSSVAETVGRATTQLRDLVSSGPEAPTSSGDTQPSDSPDISDRPARSGPSDASSPDPSDASSPDPSDASSPDPSDASSPDSSPDPEAEWPDDWNNAASDPAENARSSRNEGVTTGADTDADAGPDADADISAGALGGDPDSTADGEIIDADARRDDARRPDSAEDLAQASARSDVVSRSELDETATETPTGVPGASSPGSDDTAGTAGPESSPTDGSERPADGEVVSEPTGEEPDLADLREQLNDQFESIKILNPGQYELNLMELYDREEYIIALQENGRYVIQVPEQWIGEDPDDR